MDYSKVVQVLDVVVTRSNAQEPAVAATNFPMQRMANPRMYFPYGQSVNLMNQAALLNRGALQQLFPQGTMATNPQQCQQIRNVGALQSTNFNLQAVYWKTKMIIKLLCTCPPKIDTYGGFGQFPEWTTMLFDGNYKVIIQCAICHVIDDLFSGYRYKKIENCSHFRID